MKIMLTVTYPFFGGPLDGQEITLPVALAAPTRLDYYGEVADIEHTAHYYFCSLDDEDGLGYAWSDS